MQRKKVSVCYGPRAKEAVSVYYVGILSIKQQAIAETNLRENTNCSHTSESGRFVWWAHTSLSRQNYSAITDWVVAQLLFCNNTNRGCGQGKKLSQAYMPQGMGQNATVQFLIFERFRSQMKNWFRNSKRKKKFHRPSLHKARGVVWKSTLAVRTLKQLFTRNIKLSYRT